MQRTLRRRHSAQLRVPRRSRFDFGGLSLEMLFGVSIWAGDCVGFKLDPRRCELGRRKEQRYRPNRESYRCKRVVLQATDKSRIW
jgi:hypothetical protein